MADCKVAESGGELVRRKEGEVGCGVGFKIELGESMMDSELSAN